MKQENKNCIKHTVVGFHLPRYQEIPNVGLYLEQTTKYIEDFLEPFHDITLTGSMISNYVKKGLIENPIKKQYYRDQIAYLIFIAFAKSVLSLDNIRMLVDMQKQIYSNQRAYNYFCDELENLLFFVFNVKDTIEDIGVDLTDEKLMLRNTIITICHKLYLDQCFVAMEKELEEKKNSDCVSK